MRTLCLLRAQGMARPPMRPPTGMHAHARILPVRGGAGGWRAVGYPPTAVGHPPTAVGHPPTAVGHPPTAVSYPSTAVGYPPTAVGYPPTAVGYTPTGVGYPSTPVSYPPTACDVLPGPSECTSPCRSMRVLCLGGARDGTLTHPSAHPPAHVHIHTHTHTKAQGPGAGIWVFGWPRCQTRNGLCPRCPMRVSLPPECGFPPDYVCAYRHHFIELRSIQSLHWAQGGLIIDSFPRLPSAPACAAARGLLRLGVARPPVDRQPPAVDDQFFHQAPHPLPHRVHRLPCPTNTSAGTVFLIVFLGTELIGYRV